jgi:hypothetical protein
MTRENIERQLADELEGRMQPYRVAIRDCVY